MKIRLGDGCEVNPKYTSVDMDRHGNVRVYVRRHRRKVRIRNLSSVDAFMAEYQEALESGPANASISAAHAAARGSLRWLVERYYNTAEYRGLQDSTRAGRRGILDAICMEHGSKPFAVMQARHVRIKIRDTKADYPEAANARVKALRQVFSWAVGVGHTDTNPAREVPYLRSKNPDGFHTWTEDEVKQYVAKHPLGAMAHKALAIGLYVGVRRSDAVLLGRQMEREGWLHFTEVKGRSRTPKHRELPILPELRAALDASPSGHLTYLVTEFGKPFTANGFGNWFRKRCNEAGLRHCSFHGLRKAGATIAAENGATEHQLMAIYGWESPKQAAIYTRKADRKRLAGDAMHLLIPDQTENESVPLSKVVSKGGAIGGKK